MEWNGLRVHRRHWEPRHPQDFVRGVADEQSVPNARPRPADRYVGPRTTTISVDADAGDTEIQVGSTSGWSADDEVSVQTEIGDVHRTTLASVDSATQITLTAGLPWEAKVGKMVTNFTSAIAGDVAEA